MVITPVPAGRCKEIEKKIGKQKIEKTPSQIHGVNVCIGTLLWFPKPTGFQDSEPGVALVGSAQ
jgi:hypothetical protein